MGENGNSDCRAELGARACALGLPPLPESALARFAPHEPERGLSQQGQTSSARRVVVPKHRESLPNLGKPTPSARDVVASDASKKKGVQPPKKPHAPQKSPTTVRAAKAPALKPSVTKVVKAKRLLAREPELYQRSLTTIREALSLYSPEALDHLLLSCPTDERQVLLQSLLGGKREE